MLLLQVALEAVWQPPYQSSMCYGDAVSIKNFSPYQSAGKNKKEQILTEETHNLTLRIKGDRLCRAYTNLNPGL